jgi:AraC-like DNA-binding protein
LLFHAILLAFAATFPRRLIPMANVPGSVPVRARGLTGFAELVTQHGGDYEALLNSVGIPLAMLDSPEGTLEHQKLVTLFERAAVTLQVSDFGLRLASLQGIEILGPVALMARHAATVGDAIAAIRRHLHYHSPGADIRLDLDRRGTRACLRYELHLPSQIPHRQNTELAYSIAVKFLRLVSSTDPGDWLIHFAHRDGLSPSKYRRHLGCEVRLAQEFDALFFPADLLNVRIDISDPVLARTAASFVSDVMRRFPLDVDLQVKALIVRQLASGGCTLSRVAQQLRLPERTLQRRLHGVGQRFEDIVDRVRRDRASEYLLRTAMPLRQISTLLGYTEQSTFIRACRRWFGSSPLAFRDRSSASPPGTTTSATSAFSGESMAAFRASVQRH